jgi:2-polyprenyl-3-methyl-5-hydroxy-6-metoxy-1,4-benzoquinol methylase
MKSCRNSYEFLLSGGIQYMKKSREPQYQICLDIAKRHGLTRLGLMSNQAWHDDPRRLLIGLARYKFVAKMLSGRKHVLEVGCADAFATRVVLQEVEQLTAIDFDPIFVADAKECMDERWKFQCQCHNIVESPVLGKFDGAYSIDVLEHITKEQENKFVFNIVKSLTEHGVLIIGTPSLQSQVYASAPSKAGHINCKDHTSLKDLMSNFFHNIFIFSMNDEIIHTGFYPMAHYLFALCCSKRSDLKS